MNAAVATASAGRARPWRSAGPLNADSGLRLLLGGAWHRRLRWSPDPDAPDARALNDGELRLAIRWVELTTHDLWHTTATAGLAQRPGRDDWQPVCAIGCAEVLESRLEQPLPSPWLLGPLHVGTHLVLRLLSSDEAGCIAAEAADVRQRRPLRYTWIPALPAGDEVSGLDAVEQAVRTLLDQADPGGNVRLSLTSGRAAATGPSPQ